jgi:hypothetical protein
MSAVGMQPGGEDAGFVVGCEHHCAGAVTEKHAGGPVIPVQDPREDFGTNHQGATRDAAADEPIRRRQRVNEAAADCLHVEGRTTGNAERLLDQAGGARKHVVGRRGGADDQVDVRSRDPGRAQCRLRRLGSQHRAGDIGLGQPALLDPGPGDDPLVGSLHTLAGQFLRQFAVGDAPRRQGAADPDNP